MTGQNQPTKRIYQGLLKKTTCNIQHKVSTDCRFPASEKIRRMNLLKIQSNLCFSGSFPFSVNSKIFVLSVRNGKIG